MACLVLSCLVLLCLVLSCLVLSCHFFYCLVLSCLVISRLLLLNYDINIPKSSYSMGKAKGRGRGQKKAKPVPTALTTRQSPRGHVPKVNSLANPRANPLSNPRCQPLALVANYTSPDDDDDASSEENDASESSLEDSGLDIIEFPPDAEAELFFKDSVSSTPGLRVVRVRDYEMLDSEGTIFEIVFRSGYEMSVPHSDMVLAVEAHNDLVESLDPMIVSQMETALKEQAVPAYLADRGFRLVDRAVAKLGQGILPDAAGKEEGTMPVDKANDNLGPTQTVKTSLSVGEPGARDLGPVTPLLEKENSGSEVTKWSIVHQKLLRKWL